MIEGRGGLRSLEPWRWGQYNQNPALRSCIEPFALHLLSDRKRREIASSQDQWTGCAETDAITDTPRPNRWGYLVTETMRIHQNKSCEHT